MFLIFYGIVPLILPPLLTYSYLTNKHGKFRKDFHDLLSAVNSATANPSTKQPYFQCVDKLKDLWNQRSARHYGENGVLEFQKREGFCGSATMRCILKSLGLPGEAIPPQEVKETKPEQWCKDVAAAVASLNEKNAVNDENGEQQKELVINTEIIYGGDMDYPKFLATLRRMQTEDNVRIGVNFLRPVLTGFPGPRWVPIHFFLGFLGGHFSPAVGIVEGDDENDPLVGVWDTNHKYGGAYLVPATKLYEAVRTKDLFANKYRALVVLEKM